MTTPLFRPGFIYDTDSSKRILISPGGSSNTTVTLSTIPSANATITIPNTAGAAAAIILSETNQTINGTKTFTSPIEVGTITTTVGSLSLNPTGANINCNTKNLTNVSTIDATEVTTPLITTSAGNLVLSPASNLSLNPTGTNINCNNKNLTNIGSLHSYGTQTIGATLGTWSAGLTLESYKAGNMVTLSISGSATKITSNGIWLSTGVLAADLRPTIGAQFFVPNNITAAVDNIVILITSTGNIEISRNGFQNFGVGESINPVAPVWITYYTGP